MNDNFKETIKEFPNEKLCEIIASNRYLGILREEAISCMIELATRRSNGDIFDYESYIENIVKSLPNFNEKFKLAFQKSRSIF